jgi:hypothetical protein
VAEEIAQQILLTHLSLGAREPLLSLLCVCAASEENLKEGRTMVATRRSTASEAVEIICPAAVERLTEFKVAIARSCCCNSFLRSDFELSNFFMTKSTMQPGER